MKNITSPILIAALGGSLTLTAYLLLFQNSNTITFSNKDGNPLPIQTKNISGFAPDNLIDFTDIAEQSVDAVVHVKNITVQVVSDPFADMFYGRQKRKYAQVGSGSGVIISSDGYIITNSHVIENATEIEITLNNKKTYTAQVIGSDSKNDIALIKIEEEELPYLSFGNSDEAKIGEWVLAIGNPYNLTSTVTAGIISAKSRDLEGNKNRESFIQTDAAVNPGNSGGALINKKGELIGINTAISSQTGSFIGYSFAVPANIAKKVVEDLQKYGNVQRAILGVNGSELNDAIAKKLDLNISQGFYISNVVNNSGAEKAGILPKDIIIKLDNINVNDYADLSGYLNSKEPNQTIDVTVLRNGNKKIIRVTLSKDEFKKIKRLGLILKDLSKTELQKLNLKNGVEITKVESKELSYYGIKKGYVITKINGVPVSSTENISYLINNKYQNLALRLEILNLNGEKERYIFR